mmetsp:Transcript_18510/g.51469  ORF Transcript_18510/g.51469 Transcript_18510/m.51469 type:complete len:202 (-) Transcript_18510:372-977(-)
MVRRFCILATLTASLPSWTVNSSAHLETRKSASLDNPRTSGSNLQILLTRATGYSTVACGRDDFAPCACSCACGWSSLAMTSSSSSASWSPTPSTFSSPPAVSLGCWPDLAAFLWSSARSRSFAASVSYICRSCCVSAPHLNLSCKLDKVVPRSASSVAACSEKIVKAVLGIPGLAPWSLSPDPASSWDVCMSSGSSLPAL